MDLLHVQAVLFDFDGTLIDSYPGIQQAFDEAYFLTYSFENSVSIQQYIGPSINEILVSVNKESNSEKIASFILFFKRIYDSKGFKSSVLYSGIKELLEKMIKNNLKLFVVTNKREKATKLIANYLNIDTFFSGFYSSDSKAYYSSKGVIVKDVLELERLKAKNCVFIGDTVQDENAAAQNHVPFIYASYGYGSLTQTERSVQNPLEILNFINYKKSNGK